MALNTRPSLHKDSENRCRGVLFWQNEGTKLTTTLSLWVYKFLDQVAALPYPLQQSKIHLDWAKAAGTSETHRATPAAVVAERGPNVFYVQK